jgi:hypothetical protein
VQSRLTISSWTSSGPPSLRDARGASHLQPSTPRTSKSSRNSTTIAALEFALDSPGHPWYTRQQSPYTQQTSHHTILTSTLSSINFPSSYGEPQPRTQRGSQPPHPRSNHHRSEAPTPRFQKFCKIFQRRGTRTISASADADETGLQRKVELSIKVGMLLVLAVPILGNLTYMPG